MPHPAIGNVTADVTQATTVQRSAIVLINGIAGRIDAAVKEALANGATAEELVPLSTLSDELEAATTELAAAVEANTPKPPTPTEPPSGPDPVPSEVRANAARGGRGR